MPKYFRTVGNVVNNLKIVSFFQNVFLFCIMYKFHNSYFVIFVIFVNFINLGGSCFIYFLCFIIIFFNIILFTFKNLIMFDAVQIRSSTSPLVASSGLRASVAA